jgi:dihydrofolate reductase
VDVRFVQGVVRAAYDDMMNARPGQNVWLVGGGDLVGQFADADLLGQISLGMAPVTLGEGEAAAAATVDLHSVEVPGSAAGRATAPRRARRRAQITTTADRQL